MMVLKPEGSFVDISFLFILMRFSHLNVLQHTVFALHSFTPKKFGTCLHAIPHPIVFVVPLHRQIDSILLNPKFLQSLLNLSC